MKDTGKFTQMVNMNMVIIDVVSVKNTVTAVISFALTAKVKWKS